MTQTTNIDRAFQRWTLHKEDQQCCLCRKKFSSPLDFYHHLEAIHRLQGDRLVVAQHAGKMCKICLCSVASLGDHLSYHADIPPRVYFQSCVAAASVGLERCPETSPVVVRSLDTIDPQQTNEVDADISGESDSADGSDAPTKNHVRKGKSQTMSRENGDEEQEEPILPMARKNIQESGNLVSHRKEDGDKIPIPTRHSKRKRKVLSEYKCSDDKEDRAEEETNMLYIRKKPYYWLNKCTYTCKGCPEKTFHYYYAILAHAKTEHQMTMGELKKEVGYDSKIRYHPCYVCKLTIINDEKSIRRHVKKHDLTVQQYHDKYSHKKDFGKGKVEPTLKHKNLPWLNLCKYVCSICQEEFNNSSRLRLHNVEIHKITKKREGVVLKVARFHQCAICQSVIVNNTSNVGAHMMKAHGLSIKAYDDTYGKKYNFLEIDKNLKSSTNVRPKWLDKCEFKCMICLKTFNRAWYAARHVTESHEKVAKLNENYERSITRWHKCLECEHEVLHTDDSIANHLARSHNGMSVHEYTDKHEKIIPSLEAIEARDASKRAVVSATKNTTNKVPDWIDKCTFTCKLCQVTFTHFSKMSSHARVVHKMSVSKMKKQGKCRYVRDFITCKLCGSKITGERIFIRQHLRLYHNMTISEYAKSQKKGSGRSSSKRRKDESESSSETEIDESDLEILSEIEHEPEESLSETEESCSETEMGHNKPEMQNSESSPTVTDRMDESCSETEMGNAELEKHSSEMLKTDHAKKDGSCSETEMGNTEPEMRYSEIETKDTAPEPTVYETEEVNLSTKASASEEGTTEIKLEYVTEETAIGPECPVKSSEERPV